MEIMGRRMKKILIILILAAAPAFGAYADAGKGYTSREYPWVMRSAAALGMGNAYYTKSDSKYAPFYNPAGLSRIKQWRFDLLPLEAQLSNHAYNFSEDIIRSRIRGNSRVAEIFRNYIGTTQFGSVSLYPGFTKKNFTLGIFANTQFNAQAANPVLPELNMDLTGDAGAVIGIAHAFFDDALQVGIAGRYQIRYSYEHSYLFSDFTNKAITNISDKDFLKEGSGMFFDAGFIYTLGKSDFRPRIGFAANNIGGNSLGGAKYLPHSFTASFGISPSISFIQTDMILDVIDISRNFDQDNDWGKRINAGIELKFDLPVARRFCFRGGLHQGYPACGAGLDTGAIQINYAHYREEIGAYAGQNSDSRHVLEIIIGF
jgi:hypothetical protein